MKKIDILTREVYFLIPFLILNNFKVISEFEKLKLNLFRIILRPLECRSCPPKLKTDI